MTLSPKQKLYLTGAAFVLAAILISGGAIWPLLAKIRADGLTLAKQKAAAASLGQNRQDLELTKKQYEQARNELAGQAAWLAKETTLNFITAVENMADATNNRQEISLAAAPKKNDSDSDNKKEDALSLQTTLYGSFPNLIKFLIRLENAPYFNEVETMRIIRLIGGEKTAYQTGDINTVIKLNAYYQP